MKNKNMVEPRSQERSVPHSEAANITAILTTDVAEISDETTSEEGRIREVAFRLYEQRGYLDGHDVEDWLEAETIIRSQTKHIA